MPELFALVRRRWSNTTGSSSRRACRDRSAGCCRSLGRIGPGRTDFASFRSWVEPGFRRPRIADRYRGRFLAFSRMMFLLSAFATFAAAVSVVVHDEAIERPFAYLEVVLMVAALALWLLVRRRLHGRWINVTVPGRTATSAAFLAFLGTGRVMDSNRRAGTATTSRSGSRGWSAESGGRVHRLLPRTERSMA